MTYATDGKRHNAEPGTFNHECGKPATWIGRTARGFESGYCDDCKARGYEARRVVSWRKAPETLTIGSLAEWFDFQDENADGLALQGFWPLSALNAALRGELLIGGGAAPLFRVVIDPAVAARIKPVVDSWGQVDTASDQYV